MNDARFEQHQLHGRRSGECVGIAGAEGCDGEKPSREQTARVKGADSAL